MKKFLLFSTIVLAAIVVYVLFFMSREEENFIPGRDEIIPDQYIVFMKESFEAPVIKNRKNDPDRKKQQNDNKADRDKKEKKVEDFIRGKGVRASRILMKFADVKVGAVIKVSKTKAEEIKADSANVEDVIPDVNIEINPIQQSDPSLEINPIQQWRSEPISLINPIQQSDSILRRYDIDPTNHTTRAIITAGGYIDGTVNRSVIWFLDTGIDTTHPFLNVNTSLSYDFINNRQQTNDDNGHGTFCAGVAAGKPVGEPASGSIHIGVSEGATVVAVKVLDKDGRGTWGTVIAGLNYIAKLSQPGDIVNLSLGSYEPGNQNCYYPGIKNAIKNVTTDSVFVTLSAGNNAGYAMCNRPGCISTDSVFTASSINADSSWAPYANFSLVPDGAPIDFVTVGTRVFSLWKDRGYRMASGTSVSSALLAGIIHAKRGRPVSRGTVSYLGSTYNIAVH